MSVLAARLEAGRRSGDVGGSWRPGRQVLHAGMRKHSGRQIAPEPMRCAHRQGGHVRLDDRDRAHRAATDAAQAVAALRVIRASRHSGPGHRADGRFVAGQRSGSRHLSHGVLVGRYGLGCRFGACPVPRVRSGGKRPGKRQQDDQRGRLQRYRQRAIPLHFVLPIPFWLGSGMGLPTWEGQEPTKLGQIEHQSG